MKRHNIDNNYQIAGLNNGKTGNLAVGVCSRQNRSNSISITNNRWDTVLPLEFLKDFKRKYPLAFDKMTDIRAVKGKDDIPDWPDWCYIPMGATFAFSSMADPLNHIEVGQQLAALSPWRIGKQLFNMDPDLEAALSEQKIEEMPSEILVHLPFYAFYVKCNNLRMAGKDYDGFFVHLEYDCKTFDTELRALLLADDFSTLPVAIHIDCHTLKENLDRFQKVCDQNNSLRRLPIFRIADAPFYGDYILLQTKILNIVLYICSKNADMKPRSPQPSIRDWNTSSRKIRDRYGEVRLWDVGVRHGNLFRAQKSVTHNTASVGITHNERHSPRPHLRRGHFHHFLIGKRNVPLTERRYELKWVAPTFVGAYEDSNDPVVIQFIDSDRQ